MTASPQLPASLAIDIGKITLYLLSTSSEEGQAKARYFLSYGFSREAPEVMAQAFFEHTASAPLVAIGETIYGRRFVFEGALDTPRGPTGRIRTIWEVRTKEEVGRFVTAYPCR